jgi:hypothetical protein
LNNEKREIIVIGFIGLVVALLICALGAWLFYLNSTGDITYIIFGINLKGGTAAAIVSYIGVVALILVIRKTVRSLSALKNADS